MKTINKDIDIFKTYEKAYNEFCKCNVPAHLLKSNTGDYFLDRSCDAINQWPKLYTLVDKKDNAPAPMTVEEREKSLKMTTYNQLNVIRKSAKDFAGVCNDLEVMPIEVMQFFIELVQKEYYALQIKKDHGK